MGCSFGLQFNELAEKSHKFRNFRESIFKIQTRQVFFMLRSFEEELNFFEKLLFHFQLFCAYKNWWRV